MWPWVILCLAVLVQYRLVTDEQTDGRSDRQTDRQTRASIYRASVASRGKNESANLLGIEFGRMLVCLISSLISSHVNPLQQLLEAFNMHRFKRFLIVILRLCCAKDDVAVGLYSFDAYEDGSDASIWRRTDTGDEAEVPFWSVLCFNHGAVKANIALAMRYRSVL